MSLPSWPPEISEEHLQDLSLQATTYALAHGLLYLPPATTLPPIPSSAIHAPFALFPTPFPRKLFNHAQSLQRIYNALYARVASDQQFLDNILNADTAVGRVDTFVGELWKIWKEVREEGFAQPLQLGIFRSDYLLHGLDDGRMELKQVEINTISASFGALSQTVDGLHRYLMASTGYHQCSNILTESNLPENNTRSEMVEGLVQAHKAYTEMFPGVIKYPGAKTITTKNKPVILIVTQPNERNVFDQRPLEYELLEKHGIHIIRRTFEQLADEADLFSDESNTRVLLIRTKTYAHPIEVSVVYYRCAYTPIDFPTPQHYQTRKLLERSRAINCPSLALQLAGSKKIQAILSNPGVVESFLLSDSKSQESPFSSKMNFRPQPAFSQEDVAALRSSWVEMWVLEQEGGVERALDKASHLVLKPQREGGGNNVYKSHIPPFLSTLPDSEREAWIAMELINVPHGVQNWLVRSGKEESVIKSNVISELGTFGWALFGWQGEGNLKLKEGSGGYLLRTKAEESDEGGVAAGFSVLDSVVLVD